MKKFLCAALVMVALSVSAQDTTQPKNHAKGNTFSAPIRNRPRPTVEIQETSPVQGILPHATRVDQPLQMINPLAPREYGTGQEFISGYNDDPGQGPKNQKHNVLGLKLFSLEF